MKWSQAALLKSLREGKGWSQKQLAEVAGISQQAIAHWELGDREPSATNLFALCRALGVGCEVFAGDAAPETPAEPTPSRPRGRPKKDDAPGPSSRTTPPKKRGGKRSGKT